MRVAYLHSGINEHDLKILSIISNNRKDWKITLIASEKVIDPYFTTYQGLGISIIQLKQNFAGRVKLFFDYFLYKKELQKERYDLVISSELFPWGWYATSFSGSHVSFAWGSDLLIYSKIRIIKHFIKKTIHHSKFVVLNSEVALKRFETLVKNADQKSLLWYWNATHLPKIKKNKEIASHIRKRLGWENKIIIVSNRWLSDLYNVDKLVFNFPSILERSPKARLLIVNEGPLLSKLQDFVIDNKIEPYVKFLGRVRSYEEMLQYIYSADIFVSISSSDANSTALLEAINLGIPCTVSNIPANLLFIQDGISGAVVDPSNPLELVEKLVKLSKDPELRKQIKTEYNEKTVPKIMNNIKSDTFFNKIDNPLQNLNLKNY